MTSAVPRLSYPDSLIADPHSLYNFILNRQLLAAEKGNSSIISFCQKISPVDLLEILSRIASNYPTHFYWENRYQETAFLGYGMAFSATFHNGQRFLKAQKFIENCQKRIIKIDNYSDITPRIFCSFTFFDSETATPFPSATLTLPKFQIIKKQSEYFFITNLLTTSEKELENSIEETINNLKTIQNHPPNLSANSSNDPHNYYIHPTYNFQVAVADALKSIHAQHFSKIVLAHALDVVSPLPFHLVNCLDNLRQRHPDCYTFSISNGRGHHFIGASPERLLSVHQGQLITDALAGSAPRGQNALEDALFANKLLASEKEQREHRAVSDFINQRLRQIGLNPQNSPSRLLKLSNIQHLWTPIHAKLKPSIHPLEIVAQLHPTPAVAGVPTDIALAQIRHYETFDRSLYAAPLGWIDCQNNSEFIVGIRSALIEGDRARLYAGAGIVSGSDPEKELAEIQLKFQALLKALT
jgi:menaquinone-specific isochorismate synthase